MSDEKICKVFLRASAATIRKAGLARGTRWHHESGRMCLLGAMDHCGIDIPFKERIPIENHVASLLPACPKGSPVHGLGGAAGHIAWWNDEMAENAEEVASKLEEAAETC